MKFRMENEELGIIVQVRPYLGKDTWLDCGGQHLTEKGDEKANFASTLENKVMYAIIHISKNRKCWSDWGYKTRNEALETLKVTSPKAKILFVE